MLGSGATDNFGYTNRGWWLVYLLGVRKQVIGPMASTNAKEVSGPMAGWVTKRTCIFANEQLAGLFPDDGNLLIACVKIATYN